MWDLEKREEIPPYQEVDLTQEENPDDITGEEIANNKRKVNEYLKDVIKKSKKDKN